MGIYTKFTKYMMHICHYIPKNRTFLKVVPYFSLIVMSLIFLILYFLINNIVMKSILINLTADSLFILIAYFGYEVISKKSKDELSKELFIYAKHHVDPIFFKILHDISKVVYPIGKASYSNNIFNLLKMKQIEIENIISNKKYMGFQLFKACDNKMTASMISFTTIITSKIR